MEDHGMEPGDELYTVEPGAFVAARNELVKGLRREGRGEEADQVARRRRPPATAWALNQVAREEPSVARAVLDAGSALRTATGQALAGQREGLRTAQAAERDTLRRAIDAALGRLRDAGHPAGDVARQRLTATLRAAMVDDDVAARLAAGTLEADYEAPGLGITPDAVPEQRTPTPAPDAGAQARRREANAELRRLEAEADRLRRRADRLAAAARDADVAARAAAAAAAEAEAEAGQAEERVAEARTNTVD
jgi:hypothetical protein